MNKAVKIEIKRIPTIYPIDSFIDTIWTDRRVLRQDYYNEIVQTDRKFSTIDDPFYDNQTIQVLLYNKYRLTILVNESIDIELVRYAQLINVTLQDGTIHRAKILNVEFSEVGNTTFRKCIIEYADINRANYSDNQQPVNNFLRSDVLTDFYTDTQLNNIYFEADKEIDNDFTTGSTKKLYTKLNGFFKESELSNQTADIQGIQRLSNSRSQSILLLRFYLNEEDKFLIQKYAPRCIGEAGSCTMRFNGATYTAIEFVDVQVNENPIGIDCYQVECNLKYKNIDFNVYS